MSASSPRRPKWDLISREQAHRRVILLGTGVLLVLGLSPLFGHHLLAGVETLLAGRDHLGALCLIALHALLGPVHGLFHLLFFAGLLYATWDRFHAWRSARAALASVAVEVPGPGDVFRVAAEAADVDADLLRVAVGLPTPAFTVGWHRPKIYVDRGLGNALRPEELAAVLAHEAAHVRRRDPLRLSLLRFLTCTLFWIPALRRLADDIVDESEIEADDAAAGGRPLALASAILSLSRWVEDHRRHAPSLRAVVGFRQDDLLDRRVRRLLGEETAPGTHLTRRSLSAAAVALLLVVTSGAVVAHPLPDHATHPEHCDSHPGRAVSHLFCAFRSADSPELHCPLLRP